jgi:hypothetical protein
MAALSPTEIYRREAERLRAMAETRGFGSVRRSFLEMANRYEAMARQTEGVESRLGNAPSSVSTH